MSSARQAGGGWENSNLAFKLVKEYPKQFEVSVVFFNYV
jgi:hypothetical protein